MADRRSVRFDKDLMNLLQRGNTEGVIPLLTRNLVMAYDICGTLLHYTARCNKAADIARHLIRMGCDINCFNSNKQTPLMLAVRNRNTAVVKILLEANVDIYLTDANGKTALKMLFDFKYVSVDIFRLFFARLQFESTNYEESVIKFILAGCTMYHAAFLNDIQLMQTILNLGISVDSRGYLDRTAIHVAAESNNFTVSNWLINHGGNVNALDYFGNGPLFCATSKCDPKLIKLLLEHGANPNTRHYHTEMTPLCAIIYFADCREVTECIELLLQYGAIPHNPNLDIPHTIFDYALQSNCPNRAKYLIAQLAILEKMNRIVAKSVMRCTVQKHEPELEKLAKYYEMCKQVLEMIVYRKSSLFDLLTDRDYQIITYVRNEKFIAKVKKVCLKVKLGREYPYFYNTLMKRINKAAEMVKLQKIAIKIICNLFNVTENECYIAARKIISYLNQRDLQQLVQV